MHRSETPPLRSNSPPPPATDERFCRAPRRSSPAEREPPSETGRIASQAYWG